MRCGAVQGRDALRRPTQQFDWIGYRIEVLMVCANRADLPVRETANVSVLLVTMCGQTVTLRACLPGAPASICLLCQ